MLHLATLGAFVTVVGLSLSTFALGIITKVYDSFSLARACMHLVQLQSVHQGALSFNHSYQIILY